MLRFKRYRFPARALLVLAASALAGSIVYAGALLSERYALSIPTLASGGATTVSPGYVIQYGVLGQGLSGRAASSNYSESGGFVDPALVTAAPPAVGLGEAYVYPNPFKPNSPGRFQAAGITFKRLPAEATIRVYAITGRLVAELRKTDRTVDYYEWDVTNSGGRKLASGVYIYYVTAPGSGRARGKFAVIR
jgi:hypothetical protein